MLIDRETPAHPEPRVRARSCSELAGAGASRGRRTNSTSSRRSSCSRSCSSGCSCRCCARRRPASPPPTRTCWRSWRRLPAAADRARVPRARQAEVDLHRQAARSMVERSAPAASTPTTRRRWRRPGGCPRSIRTCRTSRSARAEGRRIRQAFIAPAGLRAAGGRLFADRAAHHGAPLRAMRACCAAFARRARHAPGDRRRGVRRGAAAVSADQRRTAKVINFGLIYGMSPFGLARNLGIERSAAQRYIERYLRAIPACERFMDDTRAQARERGYVETVFGRRLYLPDIRSRQPRSCASTPSAAPSTRRCRAPRPTSSSAR